MALTPMKFDKVWTNAADFPTHESRESQVRADIQYLFDSIKDQYNAFISEELVAENIPFDPTEGAIESTTIQDAIEYVFSQISQAGTAVIVDGSVTTAKLDKTDGLEAVSTDCIRDEAVTTDKIADGAVTAAKIAEGTFTGAALEDDSITLDKMASNSVDSDQLVSYCVKTAKIARGAVTTDKIADGNVTTAKLCQEADSQAVTTATIRNGAVTRDKIAQGAISSTQLDSGAVVASKIQDGVIGYVKTDGSIQKRHVIVGPITIATSDWNTTTKKATITVPGVSLANVNIQIVNWSAASDDDWTTVIGNMIRINPTPLAENTVQVICETVPESSVSLRFYIFD